jgi:hypothetical protein
MFPDNIERLVLDGVVDAPNYYNTQWSENLLQVLSLVLSAQYSNIQADSDTDKVLDYFYEKCADAGPQECALYEKTPGTIKARVDRLFDSLKLKPLPVVIGNGPQGYGVVDYGMVRNTVFNILYSPFSVGGKNTSIMLASLEQGDGSLVYAAQPSNSLSLQCSCDGIPSEENVNELAGISIFCSDGDPVNDTLSDLQKWFEANQKESTFAELWPQRITCAYVVITIRLALL